MSIKTVSNGPLANIDMQGENGADGFIQEFNNGYIVSAIVEAIGAITDTSSTILAASATRKGGYIQNPTNADCWISWGGVSTLTAPSTLLLAGASLPLSINGKVYLGAITAIHADSGQTHNVSIVTF